MNYLKSTKVTLSALATVALILTSCGGGGGNSNNENGNNGNNGGGETTNTVKVITDADWVAYQDSNGWHHLTPVSTTELTNTVKTYEFTPENKYGIAVYCVSNNEGNIFQFTKDDLTQISYTCQNNKNRYSVSGSISNLAQNTQAFVFIDSKNNLDMQYSGNGNNYQLNGVPEGTWDIIGIEVGNDGNSIQRVAIKRDVNVNSDLTNQDLSFVDNSVSEHNFTVNNGKGVVNFYSKNKTIAMLGKSNGINGKWYSVKNITLNDNDSYIFMGINDSETKARIEAIPARNVTEADKNIDLSNINDLNTVSFDKNTKTFSGISYNPTGNVQDIIGYIITLDDNTINWEIDISKNWLGSETSYTLPDLSTVDGFNVNWWFADMSNPAIELSIAMSSLQLKDLIQSFDEEQDFPPFKSGILEIVTQKIQQQAD